MLKLKQKSNFVEMETFHLKSVFCLVAMLRQNNIFFL